MKRKTKRILAMSLAAVFCMGILAACGSTEDDQTTQDTSDTENTTDTSETEDLSSSQDGYTAGMVLEVTETDVTVQLYTPADDSTEQMIADAADFVLADYTLSEETESLSTDDPALLQALEDGGEELSGLRLGDTVLLRWDEEDSTLAEVILPDDAAQDSRAAQVEVIGDGTLEVSWYLAESDEAEISSYLSLELDGWTLDSSTETLTFGTDTAVYRVQDGILVEAASEDISEGDTIIVSSGESGEVTQIILLADQESIVSAA